MSSQAGASLMQQFVAKPDVTNGYSIGDSFLRGADDKFYSTALYGGNEYRGTVFSFTTNGIVTRLWAFDGTNGAFPFGGVVQLEDGALYGSASKGGIGFDGTSDSGHGLIYRLTTNGVFSVIHHFNGANGSSPGSRLIRGADGALYGTAAEQTGGRGIVYRVTTNGEFSVLHAFNGTNGGEPSRELIQLQDGTFYGTTAFGGTSNLGTVFSLTTNGVHTVLISFVGTNGANPQCGLMLGHDGLLYGNTYLGGILGHGTVFKLTTNGQLQTLHSFSRTDGEMPRGTLLQRPDGSLFGVTQFGGTPAYGDPLGTVYRITTNGSHGVVIAATIYTGGQFTPGLAEGADGLLYGYGQNWNHNGWPRIYRLVPAQPPVIKSIWRSDDQFGNQYVHISWDAIAKQAYRLEYKTNLNDTTWTDMFVTYADNEEEIIIEDVFDPENPKFYRLAILLP